MAAIAFESMVKLLAFIAVGVYVTSGCTTVSPTFFRARSNIRNCASCSNSAARRSDHVSWASLTFLSMLAIMFLPRQFQVAVVENVDERHLKKAVWLFPLYLLAINIFVLPIAFAGLMHFPAGNVDADTLC